jgi:cytoskeletal protein RodZ
MSVNASPNLRELLRDALEQKGVTVEEIADRTKVPRATVRSFLGSREPAVLPQRIYLRGQLEVVARHIGVDVHEALSRFDVEHPAESRIEEAPTSRFTPVTMAFIAGLGSLAILAVILAFVR